MKTINVKSEFKLKTQVFTLDQDPRLSLLIVTSRPFFWNTHTHFPIKIPLTWHSFFYAWKACGGPADYVNGK